MRHTFVWIRSLSIVFLLALPSESFAGQFLTYTSYPGGSPFAFASGDFNGDGRPDLAVLNSTDGNVTVVLTNRDGTLKKPVTYPIGVNPSSIAVADINGDGKLDIVVANGGDPKISEFGDVGILLGNGNGTFRKAIHANVGSIFPAKLVVADFDGDGNPDLALVTIKPTPVLRIFLGDGKGTFRSVARYTVAGYFKSFLAADFNQDGKKDLAILNGGPCRTCHTVTVVLGNGNGTFQSGIVTDLPYESLTMVAGDFNNDDRVDLLTGSGVFLAGNGDGTFSIVIESFGFESAAVGDLNGDGKLDLLAVAGSETQTMLGNGDGTFQPPISYDVGPVPVAVGALDLNGDGKHDAVTFSNTHGGNIGVALGNGDGTLHAAKWVGIGGGPYPIIAADFNNDGKADVAVTEGDTFVFLGNGDGTFNASRAGVCGLGGTPGLALRAADFNHDKNLDLAVGNITSDDRKDIGVCLGNGDGTFQSGMLFFAGGTNEMDIRDLNGDGNLDLAVPTGGLVNILRGNGDGTFKFPTNAGQGTNAVYVVAGDFNGDGKEDLVVEGDFTYIVLGNGNGKFQNAKQVAPAGSSVRIGDLNGDGILDLAIFTNGSINILLGNGNGTFQSGKTYGSGFVGQWTLRDLNGDGTLDILAITGTGFGILLGNGDGTFQPQVNYPASGASYLAAADFNGDGKLDLAISSNPFGVLVVLNTAGAPTLGH